MDYAEQIYAVSVSTFATFAAAPDLAEPALILPGAPPAARRLAKSPRKLNAVVFNSAGISTRPCRSGPSLRSPFPSQTG